MGLLVLLLVFIVLFILYFLESRFFLLGKSLYPLYGAVKNAMERNFDQKSNFLSDESEDPAAGNIDLENIADTIVYCDYYTWHSETHWKRGFSNNPLLGLYDSLDSNIISQHLDWAQKYGIDVLKIEYIPQFDDSIKNGILSTDTGDTKVCLMYDSRLRFESIGYSSPPYDFDDKKISMTFLEDMDHIASDYFSSPNYFTIKGRPVLWLYVARDYTGKFKETIEIARNKFLEKGYDVYLVGDVVFWNYRLDTIDSFDAVSCYSAYAGRPQNTAELAERLKFLYMVWSISARMQSRDFIPAAMPAYDDTCLESERKSLPVLSGTGSDFKYQLEVISSFLDPVNVFPKIDQVTIATFNEHQEGSSVEPSEQWGFIRIEQIPEVFGYN